MISDRVLHYIKKYKHEINPIKYRYSRYLV
jgi:hypothetical protein